LIVLHGSVVLGQIAGMYLGILLLGSAAMAIGLLASALARNQMMAAMLGAGMVMGMVLLWQLANSSSPPFDALWRTLALYGQHGPPFRQGLIYAHHVVYYLMCTGLFLYWTTQLLAAETWNEFLP